MSACVRGSSKRLRENSAQYLCKFQLSIALSLDSVWATNGLPFCFAQFRKIRFYKGGWYGWANGIATSFNLLCSLIGLSRIVMIDDIITWKALASIKFLWFQHSQPNIYDLIIRS